MEPQWTKGFSSKTACELLYVGFWLTAVVLIANFAGGAITLLRSKGGLSGAALLSVVLGLGLTGFAISLSLSQYLVCARTIGAQYAKHQLGQAE